MSVDVVDLPGGQVTVVDLGGVTVDAATPVVVGPPGPAGPPGAGGTSQLLYTQLTPLATWTIPHALDHPPIISVLVNTAGTEEAVLADVTYPGASSVVVTFATPQTGRVISA